MKVGTVVRRGLLAVPVAAGLAVAVASLAEGSSATPSAAQVPSPDLGADLFEQHCAACHGADGSGVEGRGPSLEPEGEASADFVLRTGRMPIASPYIQAERGPVRFTEEQIVALVEHVGTIGDGPPIPDVDPDRGDVARGGELYRLNCAACHVASGAGAPIGGGRIAPSLIEASPTEVGEAIIVGPGSMPIFTSFSDEDIDDVAAYVRDLQRQDTTSPSSFGGAGPAAEGLAAWLIALVPLIAVTRWIGRPKDGRDRPLEDDDASDADTVPAGPAATTGDAP